MSFSLVISEASATAVTELFRFVHPSGTYKWHRGAMAYALLPLLLLLASASKMPSLEPLISPNDDESQYTKLIDRLGVVQSPRSKHISNSTSQVCRTELMIDVTGLSYIIWPSLPLLRGAPPEK